MSEESQADQIKRLEARVKELEAEVKARKQEISELHIKRGERNRHKAKRIARQMVDVDAS